MRRKSISTVIFLVISCVTYATTTVGATTPPVTTLSRQEITIKSVPLQILDGVEARKVLAPPVFQQLVAANVPTSDDFITTFTGDWTEEAKTAFIYATSIWSALIDPAVPITINAISDATCPFCGAQAYIKIGVYPNMPRADTLYPRTLVNHIYGYDADPEDYDFELRYASSAYDWYYGTDGNTPWNKVDFVSVVLHEIGHGLGFNDSFFLDTVQGHWGSLNGFPMIYDTFIVNGAGQSLIDTSLFPNYSPELKTQLETDDIYLDGLMTRAAGQGLPAKLQAFTDPHGYSPGTLSHLNEAYYQGTSNTLMTDTLYTGESIHNPGPVALGVLADLGWKLSSNIVVFHPLPSQLMQVNTQRINAIDLWSYIPAEQLPGTNFTFTIINTPALGAGVSLHDNRYIDLIPTLDWLGTTDVTVRATNSLGLSANQSFNVSVVSEIHSIFLPAIVK